MKKIKTAAVILVLTMLLGLLAGCENVKPVVSIGDDVAVTEPVFNYLMQYNGASLSQYVEGLATTPDLWETLEIEEGKTLIQYVRESSKDTAIQMAVYKKKAAETNVSLTDEEKQTLSQNKATMIDNIGGKSTFEGQLKSMGTNETAFDFYQETATLIGKMNNSIADGIAVDDDTLKTYFKDNYYGAQHILIKTVDANGASLPQDQITAARTKAEDILKKAKDGEDFFALMKEYSEDKAEGKDPEEYYIFTDGQMVEEFTNATKALADGAISDIVTSEYGYHIIKRINITGDEKYFNDEKETVKSSYLSREIQKQYEQWKAEYDIVVNEDYINSYSYK